MVDDRKKTMVLVGLFVVMIGVGAFQMIPKGQPAPPPKKTEGLVPSAFESKPPALGGVTPSTGTSTSPVATGTAASTTPPTIGGTVPAATGSPTGAQSASTPDAAPPEPPLAERDPFEAPPDADPHPGGKPAAASGKVVANGPSTPIKEISGSLPPLPVAGGQLVKDPGAGPKGAIGTAAAATKPAEPTFAWKLVGVMSGAHPLAVLTDATGDQRLIQAGTAIDPDSTLISVDRDSATILFRSKKLRLSLVGDQNAK